MSCALCRFAVRPETSGSHLLCTRYPAQLVIDRILTTRDGDLSVVLNPRFPQALRMCGEFKPIRSGHPDQHDHPHEH